MGEGRRATPLSVAAHSLYEQSDPYLIVEPEGHAEKRTRVSGARWVKADRPTIKIEAARRTGHRTIFLAAAADPRFIAARDKVFADMARVVGDLQGEARNDYSLTFRAYGEDGIFPRREGCAPRKSSSWATVWRPPQSRRTK